MEAEENGVNKKAEIFIEENGQNLERISEAMKIQEIKENKKCVLPLLLLGDEQESMIDRYLERGTLYALLDEEVKAVCVVTDEGGGVLEIKNIVVRPDCQRRGYGKLLIQFIKEKYKGSFQYLQAGTGESPLTLPFYEKCGFHISHRVKNFFVDNYDHPIFECGKQLVDMVYFKMELQKKQF